VCGANEWRLGTCIPKARGTNSAVFLSEVAAATESKDLRLPFNAKWIHHSWNCSRIGLSILNGEK